MAVNFEICGAKSFVPRYVVLHPFWSPGKILECQDSSKAAAPRIESGMGVGDYDGLVATDCCGWLGFESGGW